MFIAPAVSAFEVSGLSAHFFIAAADAKRIVRSQLDTIPLHPGTKYQGVLAAIVRYLFLKKRIPRLASGFQILRIVLEFLSGNELQAGFHDHLTFEQCVKIIRWGA